MSLRRSARSGAHPAFYALLACMTLLVDAPPAAAQIPDEFTNLQFFDEHITRDELIGHMRQFSFALGVRCQYCHAGGDGVSFEGVEFDSDEKPAKVRARYMLNMMRAINSTMLAGVPERRTPHVEVECATCHRGLPRPRMIADILRETIAEEGAEAGVARYAELREQFYGDWSYDFGEWEINDLAGEYAEAGEHATAAALWRMNSEYHAESVSVWNGLGDAERDAGNQESAIAAYRRALELNPNAQWIVDKLQALGVEP